MLAHWNNRPQIDMSPHSDTLSLFRANQSLLFLLNAAYLAEKQHIPIVVFVLTRSELEPTIYHSQCEHANHYIGFYFEAEKNLWLKFNIKTSQMKWWSVVCKNVCCVVLITWWYFRQCWWFWSFFGVCDFLFNSCMPIRYTCTVNKLLITNLWC